MNFEEMSKEELIEYIKNINETNNGKYGLLWDKEKEPEKIIEECNKNIPILKEIENKTAPRIKQGDDFTMAPMLDKSMAKIDWENKTALEIKNLVRGLNPIMGAYTFLNGKKIKFWKVDVAKDIFADGDMEFMKNGTVIVSDKRDGIYIKTKDGILKVLEIQGENAKKMPIQDYLRGNQINKFDVFEQKN